MVYLNGVPGCVRGLCLFGAFCFVNEAQYNEEFAKKLLLTEEAADSTVLDLTEAASQTLSERFHNALTVLCG